MLNRLLRRWTLPALALLFTFQALPVHAAWSLEPVKWRRQNNATGYNGGVYGIPLTVPFDTATVTAAASRVDTTAEWNMLDTEPSSLGATIGGSTADSTQLGAFIVCGDSTVASSFTWGATTCQFQVNYGTQSTGWTSVGSTISPLATTTQKAIIFPIWQLPVATAHLGSTAFNATYNIFAPRCRAIITWGASAAVPTARAYVRKWIGTGYIQHPKSDQTITNQP